MGIFAPKPKVGDRYRMKGDANHIYEVQSVNPTGIGMISNVGIHGIYTLKQIQDHFKKVK